MVEDGYSYMAEADKLYEAIRLRDDEAIQANNLFDSGVFIHNCSPDDESSVLHVAARYGNHGFISTVLDRFPTFRYELLCKHNSKGQTPLHIAAQFGDLEIVKTLLEAHDVDVFPFGDQKRPCWSERDSQGDTPLHCALRSGHEDIALLLLQRDSQLVSLWNNVGESPAYLAADNICVRFLRTILDADRNGECRVSFSGPFGQTAFHPARKLKLTDKIMSMAIERRRHLLKVQDEKGKTVLHYVVEEKRESIVEALLKADSSLAWLHDNEGLTPLHKAASMGILSMIEIILGLSPRSIQICDKYHGKTALHIAKLEGSFLAGCLKKTRMKELINEVDSNGNTLLHIALMNSDLQSANTLLEDTDINWRLKNKQGYTPMDLCKSDDEIPIKLKRLEATWRTKESTNMEIFNHKDVTNVDDLLDHYKNNWDQILAYQGPGGNSVFHIAARDGHTKLIKEVQPSNLACRRLLLSGKNSEGETPLHLAAEYGHIDVVRLILNLSRLLTTKRSENDQPDHQTLNVIENGVVHGDVNDQPEHPTLNVTANGEMDLKPWRIKSRNGDTPVHKALRNFHRGLLYHVFRFRPLAAFRPQKYRKEIVALHLLRLDPELASFVNNANESLLYLAAVYRCYGFVKEILSDSTKYNQVSICGPDGQNPLHAASRFDTGGLIVIQLIKKRPDLLNMVDNNGMTPLHYAAVKGRPGLVRKIVEQNKSSAFVHDNEGFTPLHRAAASGDFAMYLLMKAILDYCPLSAELRDVSNNMTVLHLITGESSYDFERAFNHKNMAKLINVTDRDGNTPLHCAVLESNIAKVLALLKLKGVNQKIRNKKHMTPLDLCQKLMRNGDQVEEQRKIENAFQRHEVIVVNPIEWVRHGIGMLGKVGTDVMSMEDEELKQMLNNMSLVATLLVTITFAALFTIPGGYYQNSGQPLRMKEFSVKVFVFADVLAMLLGITVLLGYTYAISVRWIGLGAVAGRSITLIRCSLGATVVAFLCGLYAMVSHHAIWILILSIAFTAYCAWFPWL